MNTASWWPHFPTVWVCKHLEAVEDAAQSALMKALEAWTIGNLPDNPSGWLFKVAKNDLFFELRQKSSRRRILEQQFNVAKSTPEKGPECLLHGQMGDDVLRMLFVCCDASIPVDSQLVSGA